MNKIPLYVLSINRQTNIVRLGHPYLRLPMCDLEVSLEILDWVIEGMQVSSILVNQEEYIAWCAENYEAATEECLHRSGF